MYNKKKFLLNPQNLKISSMTFIGIVPILLFMTVIIGCQKELNIADFEDDFKDYFVELRIEAILDPVDPMNSVVRIDRTILVTDTSLFNGRDDDGDWVGFTDLNGNGKWDDGEPLNDDVGAGGRGPVGSDEGKGNGRPDRGEPHVDEYDEILPQIHDSTATVNLYHKTTNSLVAEFEWVTRAGEFKSGFRRRPGDDDSDNIETFTYGGYKPLTFYSIINYGETYEFRINTIGSDGAKHITGSTAPLPPAEFDGEGLVWDNDTLVTVPGQSGKIVWYTYQPELAVVSIQVERIIANDSTELELSHEIIPQESDDSGHCVYEFPTNMLFPGLKRVTVTVLDDAYGNYFISDLPIRDEQMSNLRDQNDNVVLGIAGSAAPRSVYVRIEK